jgi:gliding motility-associated lipoprotein GldH
MIMLHRIPSIVWVSLVLACILTGCDEGVVFEENRAIRGGEWSEKVPLSFEFEMKDTIQLYDFFLNIRNSEAYPYSNLYLFAELEFPNGKMSVDTINCPLADASGNWYGSGLGDIYDNRVLYMKRRQFPLSGRYRMTIHQAMRDTLLKGVTDLGFRIKQSQ